MLYGPSEICLAESYFYGWYIAKAIPGAHEMDHSQHQAMLAYTAPVHNGELVVLLKMPASGEGRESGYDGRYLMESSSADDTLAQQYAKGSRALGMLNNKTWVKCGGKPEGAALGPDTQPAQDHTGHSSWIMAGIHCQPL